LNIGSRQSNSLASEIGARLARPVKIPQGMLVPKVSAAWLHDFGIDKLTVPASFQAWARGCRHLESTLIC
jgi:hypothetical protein